MKKFFIIFAIFAILFAPAISLAQYTTDQVPDLGDRVLYYSAASAGNGTTTLCFPELIQTGALGSTPNYIGYTLTCILDAAGTGLLPQGESHKVTGFAPTTGVLTFTDAFTLAAVGDKFWLHLEGSSETLSDLIGSPLTITGYTAGTSNQTDTITIPTLASSYLLLKRPYGAGVKTNLPGNYYLRMVRPDEDADTVLIGQFRIIIDCDASGNVVVSPGFASDDGTIVVDAGDQVEVVPFSEINPYPSFHYVGTVLSGGSGTAVFPDLIGRPNAINIGAAVYCVNDASAATNDSATAWVTTFSSVTGTVTFAPVHTPAILDRYIIEFSPMVKSLAWGTAGYPVAVTGAFPGVNVSDREATQFLADSLRKVAVSTDSTLAYLHSATGAPAVTGAFPAAGVSVLERIQFLADSLRKIAVNSDSSLSYLHSAVGAPDATGAFHAAGTSIAERISFLQDSLRAMKVTVDSMATKVAKIPGVATTSNLIGTAAADSLLCFTAVGDVYLTSLSMELITGPGATAELANFVWQEGAAGGVIVRIGEGKDLNSLTTGLVQWLNPATAVLSDSLAYGRNASSATNPIMEVVGWRMLMKSGSKIKLTLPGSSVLTTVRVSMKYEPSSVGAYVQ